MSILVLFQLKPVRKLMNRLFLSLVSVVAMIVPLGCGDGGETDTDAGIDAGRDSGGTGMDGGGEDAGSDSGGTDSGAWDGGPLPSCSPAPCRASEVVAAVDWAGAERITVVMAENDEGYDFEPQIVTLTAMQAYIITFMNLTTNTEQHHYSARAFYESIALRRVVTADAEYEAPYLDRVEVDRGHQLELHFVPVVPGTYDVECTVPGHIALGMIGTIEVVGDPGMVDQEIDPAFETALLTDPRRSGGHAVWSSPTRIDVMLEEVSATEFRFNPDVLTLTEGAGHIITLTAPGANMSSHNFTAPTFYPVAIFAMTKDSGTEIRFPYLRSVRLRPGGSAELHVVPTVVGSHEVGCTEAGHTETGTITVNAP